MKDYKPYHMQPFPRSEVAAELLRALPRIAPDHPENPAQRFFTQKAVGMSDKQTARAKALLH